MKKNLLKKRIISVVFCINLVMPLLTSALTINAQEINVESVHENFKKLDDEAEIWAPYNEEVEVRAVRANSSAIIWQGNDSYEDNPWLDMYKERFNIKLTYDWISEDYNTQINLSIAEGKIPDIMRVTATQLQQLVEADMLMDLTNLFEKSASRDLKSYMKMEPQIFESAHINDRLYAIPQLHYGYIDQFRYVWIRQDWKNELGLKDPETFDDVIEIARQFKEKYSAYGIVEDKTLSTFYHIAPAFGVYPGIWIEKDGQLVNGSIQPEMKDLLKKYKDWYAEGLINPEFMVQDYQRMWQEQITGMVGVSPAAQWWGYTPGSDVISSQGPEAIFMPYALPPATVDEINYPISNPNSGYIVINKNTENPEAIFKMVNFFAYMIDHGQQLESDETVHALFDNLYSPHVPQPLVVINPQTDYRLFESVWTALDDYEAGAPNTKDLGTGLSKYENSVSYIESQDPSGVGDYLQMGAREKSAYGIAKELLDNEKWFRNHLFGLNTPTGLQLGTALSDILTEGFIQIIIGEQPIEYFDELVIQWQEAGGATLTQEVNEMYD